MSQEQISIYPQANPMTEEEIDIFLGQSLIAKLCTHNTDGTIHVVPVWFRYANGEIFLGTQEITHKIRNIKRDNRVSVLVDTTEPRLKGVIIYGKAELVYEDVIPKRISIFEKYMPPENASGLAVNLAKTWKPVVIRIKPVRIISFDYSKGFGINRGADETTGLSI